MRRVHDIYKGPSAKGHGITVAFIQWGKAEDGFTYESVCPWCATTLGKYLAHPKAEMSQVLVRLKESMRAHIQFCTHQGSGKLQVEKATTPLQTEQLVTEQ
jgi:hypothetical protein